MPYRWIENDEIDGPLQIVGIFLVQIKVNNTIISGSQMQSLQKNGDSIFLNQNGNILSWDEDWSPHGLHHGLMTM
jgi:hypothetical protein